MVGPEQFQFDQRSVAVIALSSSGQLFRGEDEDWCREPLSYMIAGRKLRRSSFRDGRSEVWPVKVPRYLGQSVLSSI